MAPAINNSNPSYGQDFDDSSDEDEGSSDEDEGSSDEDEGSSDEDEGSSDEDEGSSDEDEGSSDEDEGSSDEDEGSSDEDEGSSDEDEGSYSNENNDDKSLSSVGEAIGCLFGGDDCTNGSSSGNDDEDNEATNLDYPSLQSTDLVGSQVANTACLPAQSWNDQTQTCETDDADCSSDEEYNPDSGQCVPIKCQKGMELSPDSGQCVPIKCQKGMELDQETGQCVPIKCQKGMELDQETGQCVPIKCQKGMELDQETGQCVPIKCQKGMELDQETGQCVPIKCQKGMELDQETGQCVPIKCQKGMELDQETGQCVPIKCQKGMELDQETGQCVPIKCQKGMELDQETGQCVPIKCQKGMELDQETGQCVPIKCQKGMELDQETGQCVPIKCQKGMELDQETGQCVPIKCQKGMELDQETGQCVPIKCQKGMELDQETGQCVPIKCQKGMELSPDSGQCVPIKCQKGMELSPDSGQCVPIKCQKGMELDQETGQCVPIKCQKGMELSPDSGQCVPIKCQKGMELDQETGQCVPIKCQKGMELDQETGQCVPIKCQKGMELDQETGTCKPQKVSPRPGSQSPGSQPPDKSKIVYTNTIGPLNITNTEKINTDVGGKPIPFQYIVIFDDKYTINPISLDTTFKALSLIVENLGGEVIFTYNNTISGFAFKTVDQQKSDQILNILSLDPRIKFAEQDKIVVPFSQQVIPSGIQRIGIENVVMNSSIEHIGIDADIAIIDSGIDLDHPDLNVFKNVTSIIPQITTSQEEQDNALRAKDIDLNKIGLNVENNLTTFYPPFSQDSSSTGDDNCGHGTHVAGIAAAKDNSFGVLGIAAGAKLWAIKVLDYDKNSGKCFGSISSVIAAIDYVTENADLIDVVNLSLGCKCNSTALDEAINKSVSENVVYVTAAGNIHTDASFFSPANHKEVLTVSAITDADGKCGSLGTPIWVDAGDFSGLSNDDTFASFSNYGSIVDIAAPGVKINSTYINGTYALMGGTSIASPHVTGMVALYKAINPTVSPKEISEEVKSKGLYRNSVCDGHSYGYFDLDSDNYYEPLLHLFDMINIGQKTDSSSTNINDLEDLLSNITTTSTGLGSTSLTGNNSKSNKETDSSSTNINDLEDLLSNITTTSTGLGSTSLTGNNSKSNKETDNSGSLETSFLHR